MDKGDESIPVIITRLQQPAHAAKKTTTDTVKVLRGRKKKKKKACGSSFLSVSIFVEVESQVKNIESVNKDLFGSWTAQLHSAAVRDYSAEG